MIKNQIITTSGVALSELSVTIGSDSRLLDARHCVTFGRDESCDWQVPGDLVSRRHAFLFWNGSWILKDLASTNGMFVDGLAVGNCEIGRLGRSRSVRLADPDLGPKIEFVLKGFQPRLERAPRSRATMTATEQSPAIVGRDSSIMEIALDPLVSRRHCEVSLAGNGLIVRDLNSRNGTYVNGSQVANSWLAPGDVVTVGDTNLDVTGERELVVRSKSDSTGLRARNYSQAKVGVRC